jgi:hypothetical protein
VGGSEPAPDVDDLRSALDADGLESVEVDVELVPAIREDI